MKSTVKFFPLAALCALVLSLGSTAFAQVSITVPVTVKGNAQVTGSISKGSGTFMIDHPLDPKKMLLFHSFVESPDVKNVYDGIATFDQEGKATVELPDYFFALNKDFRYLLTAIGTPMPGLYIDSEAHYKYMFFGPIEFSIAGGAAGSEVSWQVTGTRHDPLIEQFPIIPEVEKSNTTLVKKGECLFAPLCQ